MSRAAGQALGVSEILNLNLCLPLSISNFKFNSKLWSAAAAAAAGPRPALPITWQVVQGPEPGHQHVAAAQPPVQGLSA